MSVVDCDAATSSDCSIAVGSSRHFALSSSRRISSVICGCRWSRSRASTASLCSDEMLSL